MRRHSPTSTHSHRSAQLELAVRFRSMGLSVLADSLVESWYLSRCMARSRSMELSIWLTRSLGPRYSLGIRLADSFRHSYPCRLALEHRRSCSALTTRLVIAVLFPYMTRSADTMLLRFLALEGNGTLVQVGSFAWYGALSVKDSLRSWRCIRASGLARKTALSQ